MSTIAFVSGASYGSTDGSNLSGVAALNSTGANAALIAFADYTGVSASTLSRLYGGTWTLLYSGNGGGSGIGRLTFWLVTGLTTNAVDTISSSNAGTAYPSVAWETFSNVDQTNPINTSATGGTGLGTSGAAGTGGSLAPGALTPSGDGRLLVTCMIYNSETDCAISGGFSTPRQAGSIPGGCFHIAISHLIQTTVATADPTWSGIDAGSITRIAIMVALNPASDGGGGPAPFNYAQREQGYAVGMARGFVK